MTRSARFIKVSVDDGTTGNSNKYYKMDEMPDGSVDCRWGRVGGHETQKMYPCGSWQKCYNDRIKHGYDDVTHLHSDNCSVSVAKSSSPVRSGNTPEELFLDMLAKYAKKSVQSNYIVTSENVTQAMVDEAQSILSDITGNFTGRKKPSPSEINEMLIRLFKTIPRKMGDVHDYLLEPGYDDQTAREILSREQDVLDTMAGQVTMGQTQKVAKVGASLADIMGLTIAEVTDSAIITKIKGMMGGNGHKLRKAFRVVNKNTEERMAKFVPHEDKRELFWHGSRNENWFNILQSGLVLHPHGVQKNGSAFGTGLYFADRYQKSEGYTSLHGSYWVNGRSDTAYLALFEVLVGKQKHIHHVNTGLNFNSISREGYDSVYAHGGADLQNSEYIIYQQDQCSSRFIVEIS